MLDMDGVLAEVSQSYRSAILQTCAFFLGRSDLVTTEVVSAKKAAGGCNNDWVLSRDLIVEYMVEGSSPSLVDVTAKFEALYQGSGDVPGVKDLETLIPALGLLRELRRRCPGKMAIVTGRPRADCLYFLKLHGIESLFDACVCMEDGPPKPSPFPTVRACDLLSVPYATAVLVGDTPDDIRSALAAGARAFGVATPEDAARCILDKKDIGGAGTLSGACREAGAERLILPGLAHLLDIFEPL